MTKKASKMVAKSTTNTNPSPQPQPKTIAISKIKKKKTIEQPIRKKPNVAVSY